MPIDGSPVLPREDDPPVAPGDRPSDQPDADEWEDVTPDPSVDPCCELDEPIRISPEGLQGGPPLVAWHGEGWGVLWGFGNRTLRYASVDPDVRGVDALRDLRWSLSQGAAMAWGAGRLGVASTSRSGTMRFAQIDRLGVIDGFWVEWAGHSSDAAVARQSLRHLWGVASFVPDPPGGPAYQDRPIVVTALDDTSAIVGLQTVGLASREVIAMESMLSRVSVVWMRSGHMLLQSLELGSDALLGEPLDLGAVTLGTDSSLRSAPLRDSVAITHVDGSRVWLTLVDPFERTWTRTNVAQSRVADRSAGVVGVDKSGVLGICVPTGPGPHGGAGGGADEGVAFRMVNAGGTPLGAQVQVVDGLVNIGGCAVAYYEGSFVVVWWRASGPIEQNALWARRVRPRISL